MTWPCSPGDAGCPTPCDACSTCGPTRCSPPRQLPEPGPGARARSEGRDALGLLLGLGLTAPVGAALNSALATAGFLTNAIRPDTLRLAPPLIISAEQIEAFLAALPGALDSAMSTMESSA